MFFVLSLMKLIDGARSESRVKPSRSWPKVVDPKLNDQILADLEWRARPKAWTCFY